jgi:hypothetical protein
MYNGVCNSCDCNKKDWPTEGNKSSTAIYGQCRWPRNFDCVSYVNYKTEKQPGFYPDDIERSNINEKFGLNPDIQFFKYDEGTCGQGEQYFSPDDARLIDPRRNLRMFLDKPPYNSNVPIEEIYTDKVYEHPQFYKDYSQIHSGQIQYYYDKTNKEPYSTPNYVLTSKVQYNMFKDPMDSVKPEYVREPVLFTNKVVSKDRSTQDTLTFREDMVERLSRINNQRDYVYRYYS